MSLPKKRLYERGGHYIVYLHVKRQRITADEPKYLGYYMAAYQEKSVAIHACNAMDRAGKHGIHAYFTVVDSVTNTTLHEPE